MSVIYNAFYKPIFIYWNIHFLPTKIALLMCMLESQCRKKKESMLCQNILYSWLDEKGQNANTVLPLLHLLYIILKACIISSLLSNAIVFCNLNGRLPLPLKLWIFSYSWNYHYMLISMNNKSIILLIYLYTTGDTHYHLGLGVTLNLGALTLNFILNMSL